MTDARLDSPSFQRNHLAILDVLRPWFDGQAGDVLEIGSGSGQHGMTFAAAFPDVTWWPTDLDAEARASVAAWRQHAGLANLRPPIALDATRQPWPLGGDGQPPAGGYLALYCMNVIHISPWAVAEALFAQAGMLLRENGSLITYGPYKIGGEHTAPSNAAFDESLRARDPAWGVRDLEALDDLADRHGLRRTETVDMPANNMTLRFSKT